MTYYYFQLSKNKNPQPETRLGIKTFNNQILIPNGESTPHGRHKAYQLQVFQP